VHSIDIGQNCRGNPPLICLSATQAWVLGRNPAEDAGARRCGAFSAELGYPVGGRWEESRRARLSQVDEATETDLWYWRCYVDWKPKVTLLVIIKLACSAVQRSMRAFLSRTMIGLPSDMRTHSPKWPTKHSFMSLSSSRREYLLSEVSNIHWFTPFERNIIREESPPRASLLSGF
jgi:hypothetical protein